MVATANYLIERLRDMQMASTSGESKETSTSGESKDGKKTDPEDATAIVEFELDKCKKSLPPFSPLLELGRFKTWRNLLERDILEERERTLKVEYSSIKHINGNCYLVKMLQFKSRIRCDSTIALQTKDDQFLQANVISMSDVGRGR